MTRGERERWIGEGHCRRGVARALAVPAALMSGYGPQTEFSRGELDESKSTALIFASMRGSNVCIAAREEEQKLGTVSSPRARGKGAARGCRVIAQRGRDEGKGPRTDTARLQEAQQRRQLRPGRPIRSVRARARARTHTAGNCRPRSAMENMSIAKPSWRKADTSTILPLVFERTSESAPSDPGLSGEEGATRRKGRSLQSSDAAGGRARACAGVRGRARDVWRDVWRESRRAERAEARRAQGPSRGAFGRAQQQEMHPGANSELRARLYIGQRLHGGTSGLGGGVPITEDGMQLHEVAPFGILQGNPGGEHSRCGPRREVD